MKNVHQVKSDRYNYTHYFVKEGDYYRFIPEYDWMSLRIGYGPENEIEFIDTDGGPFITKGWSNNYVKVINIFEDNNKILFEIKTV